MSTSNLICSAVLIAAGALAVHAEVPATCTDKITSTVAANTAQILQNATALADGADKQSLIRQARTRFSQNLVAATTVATCLGSAAQSQELAALLEIRRIDKQLGAVGGGAGSTSLVSSGSIPALLGLALEYGGLTEAFNGTTATLSTTPAKLISAMAKAYGPDTKPPDEATLRALQRVSLSISFDTSRTDTARTKTQSTLLANYQQLSQASAHFILWNDRDPFAAKNWRKILDFANSAQAQEAADAAEKLLAPLTLVPGYGDAFDKAMKAYGDALTTSPTPAATVFTAIINSYVKDMAELAAKVPDWKQLVDKYVAARSKADAQQQKVYAKFAKAPTLVFDYAINRPPLVAASATTGTTTTTPTTPTIAPPDLSSGTLIFTASLGQSDYTLNARANFFNETHPTMRGNFRDFQVSGKWDIPVGVLPRLIAKGTLTFGGLYEHLHQKPLGINLTINDQTINQPGNIGVFQIKYSIPMGTSGVQIPISFTTSNRTELVKEKDNRGNIGITFDLDKLFAQKKGI